MACVGRTVGIADSAGIARYLLRFHAGNIGVRFYVRNINIYIWEIFAYVAYSACISYIACIARWGRRRDGTP